MEHVLVRKVRALAAASPDNSYHRPLKGAACFDTYCRYSLGVCDNGSVGCLIGQALKAMGYDVAPLDEKGGLSVRDAIDLLGIGGLAPTEYEWLSNVQWSQDHGSAWAKAVFYADRTLLKF